MTIGVGRLIGCSYRTKHLVDNLVENLLDLIFPKRCLSCKTVGSFICEECSGLVRPLSVQICPQCTKPSIGGFTHALCLKPLSAERVICLFKFEGPMREAISQLKYKGVKGLAESLAELTTESLKDLGVDLGTRSIIIPVPIHPVKQLERGFNQAAILASLLGKRLGIEVWSDFLLKTRDNPSQTKLKLKERAKNVRFTYRIERKDKRRKIIKGRDVIIIDDVFTSGATLRECAKIAKKAGARFVYLLAIAKG